jgi:hypothetical protein
MFWTGFVAAIAASAGLSDASPQSPSPQSAPPAQGVTSYPASFFSANRPATALDMVQLLPGFSFDGGAQVRGYADGAGNVLIDGERPTTKQDWLGAILRRIPADQVERIDVIRGGAPGVDMQGRTVLANVVRKTNTGLTGAVAESNIVNLPDGRYVPFVRIEYAKRSNGTTLEGSFNGGDSIGTEEGAGVDAQLGPGGGVLSSERVHDGDRSRTGSATLSYEFPFLDGKLKLNGLGLASRYIDQEDDFSPSPADANLYHQRDLVDRGELGAHYVRDFGSQVSLESLLIQQLRRENQWSTYAALNDDEYFAETTTLAETVGRTTLTWKIDPRLSIAFAAEGAYNIQDNTTTYLVNGVPTSVPAQDVKVEERRTEESGVVTWSPSSQVTLETGLRVEASTISSTGDVVQSKTLVYPKPRAILTWTPDAADQVRVRLEREVTQLDFGDFAATGSINAGGVRAGNPTLSPQAAWVGEVALERKFWGRGDLILTGRDTEIDDAIDRVQLDGYDEPGNVGRARQEDLRIDLALPLDGLFIPHGLIRGSGTWSWSAVTDPTTGQTRALSNVAPFTGQLHFSQDVPAWRFTWGADAGWRQTWTVWRFEEVDSYTYGTWLRPYLEYKPTTRLTLRFEVGNALDREIQRTLTYYVGPRTPGLLPDSADFRSQSPGRTVYFRVRQGF